MTTKTARSVVPDWFPSSLPDDDEELLALAERIAAEGGPHGCNKFMKAVKNKVYHADLFLKANNEVHRTWQYMHGHSNGRTQAARHRLQYNAARKFYNALSSTALRRHCELYRLDYDSFDTVDERIEAVIKASLDAV